MLLASLISLGLYAETVSIGSQSFTKGATPCAFLSTVKNNIYFETHDPRANFNTLVRLDKEGNEDGNFIVGRDMWWRYNANKKADNKYLYETKLGEIVRKTFEFLYLKNKEEYKGTPIVDEYNKNIPMYWFVENVEAFRNIAKYFEKNTLTAKKAPNKTVLVLDLADDPNLVTLTEQDRIFLNRYFIMPSGDTKNKLATFFGENREYLRETTGKVEGGKPEVVLGTLDPRKYLFNNLLQKPTGDFKAEKYLPTILEKSWNLTQPVITAMIAIYLYNKYIDVNNLREKQPKKYYSYFEDRIKGKNPTFLNYVGPALLDGTE